MPIPSSCSGIGATYNAGTATLPAGVHCGKYSVQGTATLILSPGDHYFVNGGIWVLQNGSLTGTDVALAFSGNSQFHFNGAAQVSLEGRHIGPLAGFVLVTSPLNTGVFTIQSKNVARLYGTIYLPKAKLSVSGAGGQVAQQSAWTVVVADQLMTTGAQELVINSAYSGSGVPVPQGVGPPSIGSIRLSH